MVNSAKKDILTSAVIILTAFSKCGHGLVVEHVLAKDGMGVRFSLAAHNTKNRPSVVGFLYCGAKKPQVSWENRRPQIYRAEFTSTI